MGEINVFLKSWLLCVNAVHIVTFSKPASFFIITEWPGVMEILLGKKQNRSFPNRENQHFWSASLVSLVTNLQASGSLGSSLLWVALAPWPVKKPTQRLILCATKGQMKPQLDRSWRGRIPTSFSGAQIFQKQTWLTWTKTWRYPIHQTMRLKDKLLFFLSF